MQEVHPFGGYTVTFEGRRILRSVSAEDVVPATAVGPWKPSDRAWFLSAPKAEQKPKPLLASARADQAGGGGPRGLRDLGLRVVIAVPVVAFLIYALTQLG